MLYTSKAGESALKSLALQLSSELYNLAEDLSVKAQSEVMSGIDILDTIDDVISTLEGDVTVHYRNELEVLDDKYVKSAS